MLADELTPTEVEFIKEQIPTLYRRTMGDTIPSIVILLAAIDDAQIDHLRIRFGENNREFENDFMPESRQVRLHRRVERSIDIFAFFIGELRTEQVELVTHHRNAMPLTADDWLAYHQARQKVLLAMLRGRASNAELERFLIAWWVDLADQPPTLQHKMTINTDAWSKMILALDKTLDDQQRQRLLDKLDLFIDAFSELIAERL